MEENSVEHRLIVGVLQPAAERRGREEDLEPTRPTEALIDACRRGDREAFGTLFDLCRDRVYGIALHYTGEPAAAADVTQDVFLKLLSKLHQFKGQCAFMTWLYRIVANTALDHRRSRRRTVDLDHVERQVTSEPQQHHQAERLETSAHVRAALATLSPRLRLALVLRYAEDLSYKEIGDVLEASPGTIASRLSRAHVAFARALEHLRKGAG